MKKIVDSFQISLLPLLAGVSLAFTLSLSSCSKGTDAGDVNVERANAKSSNPTKHNAQVADTVAERQEGVEHYEQTYGGAQSPPSNPDGLSPNVRNQRQEANQRGR
jgi:hypothetical protein